MMYRVITPFTDLKDDRHAYKVGDEFPRQGLPVSDDRIAELSSSKNKRGKPVIEAIIDEEKPKKKGRKKNDSID